MYLAFPVLYTQNLTVCVRKFSHFHHYLLCMQYAMQQAGVGSNYSALMPNP